MTTIIKNDVSTLQSSLANSISDFRIKKYNIEQRKHLIRQQYGAKSFDAILACNMIDAGYDIDKVSDEQRQELIHQYWLHG